MKTKQLVLNAVLAAVCAVLGFYSLDIGNNLRITFDSIPIHVGALLFGPKEALFVAFVGTFISQLLRFGITATTILWMIPYMAAAVFVGIIAASKGHVLRRRWVMPTIIMAELMITLLNTVSLYIDSKIFGYYSAALIFSTLGIRLLICVIKSVVYSEVLSPVVKVLLKTVKTYPKE